MGCESLLFAVKSLSLPDPIDEPVIRTLPGRGAFTAGDEIAKGVVKLWVIAEYPAES